MPDLDCVKQLFEEYYNLLNDKEENHERALSNLGVKLEGIVLTGREILEMDLGNIGKSSAYDILEEKYKHLDTQYDELSKKYLALKEEFEEPETPNNLSEKIKKIISGKRGSIIDELTKALIED